MSHRPPRRLLAGRLATLGAVGLALCVPTGLAAATPLTAAPAPAPGAAAVAVKLKPVGWWYDALGVGAAQQQTTGKGVTVGVLDDGIDPRVRELQGADVSIGPDCYGKRWQRQTGPAVEHGTSMVALIAGQGRGNAPGGAGVLGMAPDAKVVFYPEDTEPSAPGKGLFVECDGFSAASQVDHARRHGVDILSTSMSGLSGPPLEKALHRAQAAGMVTVAAAGNRPGNKWVTQPASIPGVVAVNAVDRSAKPWKGNVPGFFPGTTEIGQVKDAYPVISAPGADMEALRLVDGRWQSDRVSSGTSGATALVAGALALVKAKYPDATGNQLVQHLIHFTGGTRSYRWDPQYGFGIVSLQKMLAHDPTGWPDENPLLKGPAAALRDYPMSAYHDPATGQASSDASPAASGDGSKATAGGATAASDRGGADHGGVPLWGWAVGALLLVAGGAAAARSVSTRGKGASRAVFGQKEKV